tara:strand:- start:586 stop:768 length:183 start_codon:yes stop_codon:yes gene_type:complete
MDMPDTKPSRVIEANVEAYSSLCTRGRNHEFSRPHPKMKMKMASWTLICLGTRVRDSKRR